MKFIPEYENKKLTYQYPSFEYQIAI